MGGDTPEQKETAAEKISAENASQRWSERINDGYLDLEKRQITDSTRDMTSVIHGRANADLARGERAAYAAAGRTTADMDQVGNTTGQALAATAVDSSAAGLKYSDSKRINTVRIGNNMAASTTSTLGDLAALANRNAGEKLQNQVMVSNAKMQAGMQVVGGAVQGYNMKKAGYDFNLKEGVTHTGKDGQKVVDGYGFVSKKLGAF